MVHSAILSDPLSYFDFNWFSSHCMPKVVSSTKKLLRWALSQSSVLETQKKKETVYFALQIKNLGCVRIRAANE